MQTKVIRSITCLIITLTALTAWSAPTPTLPTREAIRAYLGTKVDPVVLTLALPADGLDVRVCKLQYRAAGADTRALYRLLACHLQVADGLLATKDAGLRQSGVGIAYAALGCAAQTLKDTPLALGIGDIYLLPNITAIPETETSDLSRLAMLTTVADLVKLTGDLKKLAAVYQRTLAVVITPYAKDITRLKLALVQEQLKQYTDALANLDAIETAQIKTSTAGLRAEVAAEVNK